MLTCDGSRLKEKVHDSFMEISDYELCFRDIKERPYQVVADIARLLIPNDNNSVVAPRPFSSSTSHPDPQREVQNDPTSGGGSGYLFSFNVSLVLDQMTGLRPPLPDDPRPHDPVTLLHARHVSSPAPLSASSSSVLSWAREDTKRLIEAFDKNYGHC